MHDAQIAGDVNAIEVTRLCRYYQDFCAVKELSFSVQRNEIAALLGLNGAGKTTTLRVLSGYMAASSGNVKILGEEFRFNSIDYTSNIGYLPENPGYYEEMTVYEFVRFMFRLRTGTKINETKRISLVLEKTGLKAKSDARIGTLSAGYKKRVGIAQAIAHNPAVVILDEPVADLDPVQIVEIRNLLLELKKDHTILVSSHILSEVEKVADRFLFIHRGELKRQETRDSIDGRDLEKLFLETVSIK